MGYGIEVFEMIGGFAGLSQFGYFDKLASLSRTPGRRRATTMPSKSHLFLYKRGLSEEKSHNASSSLQPNPDGRFWQPAAFSRLLIDL
jgi:hypothetical protein